MSQRGYTLIELLAVVVILAVVAAIAVNGIGGLVQRTKEQAFVANAISLKSAAEYYVKDKTAQQEEGTGELTYKTLYEEGFQEVMEDPFTKQETVPDSDSYAVAEKGRIRAVCLIGATKKLCSYKKEGAWIEGPVPVSELHTDNLTDK